MMGIEIVYKGSLYLALVSSHWMHLEKLFIGKLFFPRDNFWPKFHWKSNIPPKAMAAVVLYCTRWAFDVIATNFSRSFATSRSFFFLLLPAIELLLHIHTGLILTKYFCCQNFWIGPSVSLVLDITL